MDIEAGVRSGDRLAAARLISGVERDDEASLATLRALHDCIGDAHIVGITGSPGTGKSTLTDRLIEAYRRDGKRVGVVAVDPSSPFSGGAILGDRIRMQSRSGDADVFIRSMGTRGALGGLSSKTADAVKVLDAWGADVVLVETVGVGQAEVDIIRLADTVVVVLVPNLGDDVQAVKAGVMEIADIFVVNKADLDGSDKVHAEVEASMSLGHPDENDFWWPPILRTVAERGEGVTALQEQVAEHRAWAERSGKWHQRRERRVRAQIRALLAADVTRFAFAGDALRAEFEALAREEADPHTVAAAILASYRAEG